ncbi:MAG: sigma-54 interaction domain-containing protein, partial [Planctomycetota bacterium]
WRWERREESMISTVARRERAQGSRDRLCGLVGRSEAMQEVYERLTLASASRDAVLLTGATGTGKELAARTIHVLSGDPQDRFVPVNCAAISHDLVESELFGHRRGSFSGAQQDHSGLFRAAHGGTLFLDEVIELPPPSQAKLLRALQEHAVRPVGGLAEVPVSARIVASTNLELAEALEAGRIRRDLYYRLRQLVIHLPDLADRREDVPLLVAHFAARAADDALCPRAPGFSRDAIARMQRHDWPGNVRELENVVRLACRTAGGELVEPRHLQLDPTTRALEPVGDAAATPPSLKEAERDAIEQALRATEGNKTQAARLLGISRKQLYVKLRAYGLRNET